MKIDYPQVVIVILNWNGLADTLECLDSLRRIMYSNHVILVIDNGSKGNDADIVKRKFRDSIFVLKEDKNLGFVGGCNAGIRWALHFGAKYILLLNNDTVVNSNFLTEMISVVQNDEQIAIAGPKIYYYEQSNRIWSMGGKVNFWNGITPLIGMNELDDGRFESVSEVDFVTGDALLIRADSIRRIGLLSEIYFAYYEETEWCLKARKAGLKVVCVPKAKVWHKIYKTRSSELKLYYLTRNRFLFMKRNASSNQFLVFVLYFFMTDLAFQIKGMIFMRPKSVIAYLKGIGNGLSSLAYHK